MTLRASPSSTVSGLVFGLLLALACVGLSLIYGTTGLSNFAHGEQVTLGGIFALRRHAAGRAAAAGSPAILAVALGAATGWLQDAGHLAAAAPARRRA